MQHDNSPIANTFNLAERIREIVTAQIDAQRFRDVTNVTVYSAQPAESGKSAAFTVVMTGPNLNPGNPDTRRIFTVRVS